MARILLIDDDEELRCFVQEELQARGHTVETLAQAEQGPEILSGARFDLVLLDNKMGAMSGIDMLEALRERSIDVPVILMTGYATCDTAIRAINLGAFDYIIKPDDFASLLRKLQPLIAEALAITRPAKDVRVSTGAAPCPGLGPMLVGTSKQMIEVYKQIGLFARTDDAVLIHGETGTGKELVARAIHTNSPRKNRPFVALNCSALNETLLDDELFGHEAGAFTGADKLRKGKFEFASGGTLFLDEMGDMPPKLQAKLLRVLEYQEVERVGGDEPIKVNVRLLSATHRNLEAAIAEGSFRRDLFHRLNRVTIRLPPLRERLDDLPELAVYFLTRAAEGTERARPALSDDALQRLRAYAWPGNVRELQNVLHHAFGVCRGPEVLPSCLHLSEDEDGSSSPPKGGEGEAMAALRKAVAWAWSSRPDELWPLLHDLAERELLAFALAQLGGNQTEVGKRLGMARGTVIKRLQKYGLIEGSEAAIPG
ncbi:MAG TPA: sigma-54 dependent transcriptional regulator [Gemmataceae bacterium]|nr:sigma-54 dependent transcriptional regulator [Gemmataceae bacterium]